MKGIKKMGTIGLLLEIRFLLIGQRRIRPGMTLHMVGDLHCHRCPAVHTYGSSVVKSTPLQSLCAVCSLTSEVNMIQL